MREADLNLRVTIAQCVFWTWFFCIRFTTELQFSFSECVVMITISFVVAFAMAIKSRTYSPYSERRPLVVTSSALAVAGTLARLPLDLEISPAVQTASAWFSCFCIGISISALFVISMERLSEMGSNASGRTLSIAAILAIAVAAAFSFLKPQAFSVATALLPAILCLMLLRTKTKAPSAVMATESNLTAASTEPNVLLGDSRKAARYLPPMRPAIIMAAAEFALCFGTFPFIEQKTASPAMGIGVASVAIIFLVGRSVPFLADRFNIRMLFQISLPLMAAGLLAAPVVSEGAQKIIACSLVNLGYFGFLFLAIIILNENCRKNSVPSAWAFGFLRCAMLPSQLIGAGLVHISASTGAESSFIWMLHSVSVLAIVTCSVTFFNSVNFLNSWSLAPESDEETKSSAKISLATQCAILARANGLTHREEEVCLLIAQGKTAPQAADELFVSKETVKSHLKHAYSKLGIHSKEELQKKVQQITFED